MAYFTPESWSQQAPTPESRPRRRSAKSQALDLSINRLSDGLGCCGMGDACGPAPSGMGIIPVPLIIVGGIAAHKAIKDAEGGSSHAQRQAAYANSWNDAKKTVQTALAKIQPAFDKLDADNADAIMLVGQIESKASAFATAYTSPSFMIVRQTMARLKQAKTAFDDSVEVLRTMVDDVNAKIKQVADAEASGPATPPPGSPPQIALNRARTSVSTLARAVATAQSRAKFFRLVADSTTIQVDREYQKLQNAQAAAEQQKLAQQAAFEIARQKYSTLAPVATPVSTPYPTLPGSTPIQVQAPLSNVPLVRNLYDVLGPVCAVAPCPSGPLPSAPVNVTYPTPAPQVPQTSGSAVGYAPALQPPPGALDYEPSTAPQGESF